MKNKNPLLLKILRPDTTLIASHSFALNQGKYQYDRIDFILKCFEHGAVNRLPSTK